MPAPERASRLDFWPAGRVTGGERRRWLAAEKSRTIPVPCPLPAHARRRQRSGHESDVASAHTPSAGPSRRHTGLQPPAPVGSRGGSAAEGLQWAISSCQGFAGGERRPFAARGLDYGIASVRVDGNDFLAVFGVTRWAAERARSGFGPTLIEHVTYRGGAHSTSDGPSRYRPRDEWQAWPLGDPVERLQEHMVAEGLWSEARHAALEAEQKEHVDRCWEAALRHGSMSDGPRLDPDALFEDVYRDMPAHLVAQRAELRGMRRD